MSVPIELTGLTKKEQLTIASECRVEHAPTKYGKKDPVECYDVENTTLYIPFSYYHEKHNKWPNEESHYMKSNFKFNGTLRDYQKEARKEIINLLNKNRCVIISVFCGWGKTAVSVYLASKIGLKTLVMSHRVAIIDQWKSEIAKFSDAKVQVVNSTKSFDPEADIYIMNPINVAKRNRIDYEDIGLLIVDEVHLIPAEKMSRSLTYITPKYCIGLSATPNRRDGLEKVLHLYFGKEMVIRELKKPFQVFLHTTEFEPEVKYNAMGRLDWNAVLNSLSENKERNAMIADIACKFLKNNILILCKRVKQCDHLMRLLKERGQSVSKYSGSQRDYDPDSRILVSTYSKSGIGFDHPKLDMLMLATDVDTGRDNVIEQYVGRIFRKKHSTLPIVFDIIDQHGTLKRHCANRKKWYRTHGGKIEDYTS